MITVLIEVDSEGVRTSVVVQAANLRQAVDLVANQHPGSAVSVRFPLDPEAFFIAARADEGQRYYSVHDATPKENLSREAVRSEHVNGNDALPR